MKRTLYYLLAALLVAIMAVSGCSPAERLDPSGNTDPLDNGSISDDQDEGEDPLIDSGRYAGKTGDIIAVRISGVPDEIAPTEFKLSEKMRKDFEQYGLEIDDVIKFYYTVNEQGERFITEIIEMDSGVFRPKLTIWAYYDDQGSWGSNTIVLQGLSGSEYIEIVVEGEIVNFEHVKLNYNAGTDTLEEAGVINRIDKVVNQTIVIKTGLPDGIPLEKIKWQSKRGIYYEWIIQEDGVESQGWEFNLE